MDEAGKRLLEQGMSLEKSFKQRALRNSTNSLQMESDDPSVSRFAQAKQRMVSYRFDLLMRSSDIFVGGVAQGRPATIAAY